ncbi:flavonol synthase/flavanone 3-hydroxylase-like [Camellia sinensis]|uniref:flavonol synthase/flavanone 3-hydroxylase-like n=1 Tax=Camellia sinensis TaxID=4442 RepID=UPI0010356CA8|nr:flavonol synthase/flavanone 3-hydroxylase-like [Camellia sinensis]
MADRLVGEGIEGVLRAVLLGMGIVERNMLLQWDSYCGAIIFWEANEVYAEQMRGVMEKLFKWLSLGIGLERDEFNKELGGDEVVYLMKINYYPPLALGVVAHTDMCALTILVPNEVPRLQVFKGDHW